MIPVISVVLFLNGLFVFLLLGRDSRIVLSIQTWWLAWLLIAHISLTGLFPPSMFTACLVLASVSAITLGCLVHEIVARNLRAIPKYLCKRRNFVEVGEQRIFLLASFISLPFVTFFFGRFLWLMQYEPDLVNYRAKVFGINSPYPLLFRFDAIMSVDWFVIEPLNLAALCIGAAAVLLTGRWRLFLLASGLIMAHNIMMGGRFGIHYVIMTGIFLVVAARHTNRDAFRKIVRYGLPILAMLLGTTVLVTSLRVPESIKTGSTTLRHLIDYHTVSFSIFDHDIKQPDSMLHNPSYGRSSLGSIDRFLVRVLSAFGIQKAAASDLNGAALHGNRIVGRSPDGSVIEYGAFGTVFYSLFRDGGVALCILASVIFGFLMARFSAALSYRNFYGLSMLAALFFLGIYGIFQPILESYIYITILIILYVTSRRSKLEAA
jgi:oligosaccharide repeat unit polymerase